jgi:hypothetical protein
MVSREARIACTGMRPLATSCPPERRGDRGGPAVLPDEHGRRGAGLEGGRGLLQVVVAQQPRGRPLELGEGGGQPLQATADLDA